MNCQWVRTIMRIEAGTTRGVVGHAVRAVAAVAAVAALGACGSLTVNTDWNTSIDFSRYKTWNFNVDTLNDRRFQPERLRRAVRTALTSKGLTRVDSNPDLIVIYRATMDSATPPTAAPTGGSGWGPAWRGWGYGGYGSVRDSTASGQPIPPGALTIALVDPKLDRLVWRAVANAPPSSGVDANEFLQQAVDEMFAQFPPKKGELPSDDQF
jgi:Domain of unknown function (DUF4136)